MSNVKPFFIVAGDLLPTLEGHLYDEDGSPIDLSTCTGMTVSVCPSGMPTPIFTAASCAFSTATSGASAGHVHHDWATGAVPTRADFYQAQFRATFPNGRPLTSPNPGFVPIVVGTSMV